MFEILNISIRKLARLESDKDGLSNWEGSLDKSECKITARHPWSIDPLPLFTSMTRIQTARRWSFGEMRTEKVLV